MPFLASYRLSERFWGFDGLAVESRGKRLSGARGGASRGMEKRMKEKKCYIGVYVTPEEKGLLHEAAKEANISVSELIKRSILLPADENGNTALAEVMTVEQMADYLHVSQRKARSLCENGNVPSFAIGRQYRILKSALDDFIARSRHQLNGLPELLRPEQAANYLKVSRATIQRMITSGEIDACRIAGRWRIKREVVARMVDA